MSEVVKEIELVLIESIDLKKLVIGLTEKVVEKELEAVLVAKGIPAPMIEMVLASLNPAIEAGVSAKVESLKAKVQA